MDIAVYSALALLVIALIVMAARIRRRTPDEPSADNPSADEKPSLEERLRAVESQECCGTHAVCEKEQMIRALRQQIVYFNDEELDAYRGVAADDYDDEALDAFRDVLYTMDPAEIEDWLKSLELRTVALPSALKEETCMLIAEQRARRASRASAQ